MKRFIVVLLMLLSVPRPKVQIRHGLEILTLHYI